MLTLKNMLLGLSLVFVYSIHAQELMHYEQNPIAIYRTFEQYVFWTYLKQGELTEDKVDDMKFRFDHLSTTGHLKSSLDVFVLDNPVLNYGINIQDPANGNTILHYCLSHTLPANINPYQNRELVFRYYAAQRLFSALLARGARLDIANNDGQTVEGLIDSNPLYNYFKVAVMFSRVTLSFEGAGLFCSAVYKHFFG